MFRVGFCLAGISYLAFASVVSRAEDRLVTITIENKTPSYEVEPVIEVFGLPPRAFKKNDQNKFEYNFPVSETDWFNLVNITLRWKGAYLKIDGTKSDFEQFIALRIRRDFPDLFSFPVYFSNDRTLAEMDRLKAIRSINGQFEVYFRGGQIAAFYRDTMGPTHKFSKRAAKIFFLAAIALAEQPRYYVVMSDDAEQSIKNAFPDTSSYSDRANVARSVYWFDLKNVDTYIANGKCSYARLLLDALEDLKASNPEAFKARYDNAGVMKEKRDMIEAHCRP